jgi:hypothetical protein
MNDPQALRQAQQALEEADAVGLLIEAGAVLEKLQDGHGDTNSGWWLDGVWLSKDPRDAARVMAGN